MPPPKSAFEAVAKSVWTVARRYEGTTVDEKLTAARQARAIPTYSLTVSVVDGNTLLVSDPWSSTRFGFHFEELEALT